MNMKMNKEIENYDIRTGSKRTRKLRETKKGRKCIGKETRIKAGEQAVTTLPYLCLGTAYGAGADRAGLVEAGQDLGDAAVGDEQLPGDVTRAHPHQRQLHDATPYAVRQRASVHEHPTQLVDPGLTCGQHTVQLRYFETLPSRKLAVSSGTRLLSGSAG
jgi:hypothetical protein